MGFVVQGLTIAQGHEEKVMHLCLSRFNQMDGDACLAACKKYRQSVIDANLAKAADTMAIKVKSLQNKIVGLPAR
jgi:hypothetical protein